MYYVPDGTEVCGFYECEECGNRLFVFEDRTEVGVSILLGKNPGGRGEVY